MERETEFATEHDYLAKTMMFESYFLDFLMIAGKASAKRLENNTTISVEKETELLEYFESETKRTKTILEYVGAVFQTSLVPENRFKFFANPEQLRDALEEVKKWGFNETQMLDHFRPNAYTDLANKDGLAEGTQEYMLSNMLKEYNYYQFVLNRNMAVRVIVNSLEEFALEE